MKRVIFFSGGDDLYGANKILFNTLPLFHKYERFVCLPNRGKLSELIEATYDDIKIVIMPSLPVIAKKYLTPKGIIKFFINLWKSKSNLHNLLSSASIVYLNTLAVLPIGFYSKNYTILHVHEILANSSLINYVVNKIALKKTSRIICVSKATSENLLSIGNKQQNNKIVVVHNGIPPIQNKVNIKSYKSEKVNIVLIGRIKPQIKGQNYVLDALKYLPTEIKLRLHIIFIGSPVPGEEKDLIQLNRRIENEHLSNIVSIKPFTTDIASVYEEADVCLVPSVRADPFPTTVLEAMSARLPVIGTDLGGIIEMIEDGITGYIIPPNNPELFAEKIKNLVNDKDLRHNMGEKGYTKFVNYFTKEGYESRYKEAVRELYL